MLEPIEERYRAESILPPSNWTARTPANLALGGVAFGFAGVVLASYVASGVIRASGSMLGHIAPKLPLGSS